MLLRRYHKKEQPNPVVEQPNPVVEQQKPFEAMTVSELKDYAAANNIDLGEATKKADILAAIQNA